MTFIDTNVVVYASDPSDSRKNELAVEILADAFDNDQYVISSQVLNEFVNTALNKLKKSDEEVVGHLRLLKTMRVVPVSAEWLERAVEIRSRYDLQFYDSLLLAAAEALGCDKFLTEDLNDGQMYGSVKAVNPFKQN